MSGHKWSDELSHKLPFLQSSYMRSYMHMSTGRYNFQIEGLYLGIFSKGSSVILRPVPRSVEMYHFFGGTFYFTNFKQFSCFRILDSKNLVSISSSSWQYLAVTGPLSHTCPVKTKTSTNLTGFDFLTYILKYILSLPPSCSFWNFASFQISCVVSYRVFQKFVEKKSK